MNVSPTWMIKIKKKQKFGDEGRVSNDNWRSNCLIENADKTVCLIYKTLFCNNRMYQAPLSEHKRTGEMKSVSSKLL